MEEFGIKHGRRVLDHVIALKTHTHTHKKKHWSSSRNILKVIIRINILSSSTVHKSLKKKLFLCDTIKGWVRASDGCGKNRNRFFLPDSKKLEIDIFPTCLKKFYPPQHTHKKNWMFDRRSNIPIRLGTRGSLSSIKNLVMSRGMFYFQ